MTSTGIRRALLLMTAMASTVGALVAAAPAQAARAPVMPDAVTAAQGEVGSLSEAIADIERRRAAAPRAAAAAAVCASGTIMSAANGRYVSAELGWAGDSYGMLRARATAVDGREIFVLCQQPDGAFTITGWNGRYVSAELGWGGNSYGMLRARATAIGPWERFTIQDLGDGTYAIQSLANWRYVAAEVSWTGNSYAMLRARTTSTVGPWERFI